MLTKKTSLSTSPLFSNFFLSLSGAKTLLILSAIYGLGFVSAPATAFEVGRVTIDSKKNVMVLSVENTKFKRIPVNKIYSLHFRVMTAEEAVDPSKIANRSKPAPKNETDKKATQASKAKIGEASPEEEDIAAGHPLLMGIGLLSFDAVMPAHGHGMVVKPRITQKEFGHWQVDGIKQHMIGDWEFRFTIKTLVKEENFTMKISI